MSGCCSTLNNWQSTGSWAGGGGGGGGGGSVVGAVQVLRIPFGPEDGTYDSVTSLPAGAYVTRTDVQVVSAFSPAPDCSIVVGQAATPDVFQAAGDNNPPGPQGSIFATLPQAVAAPAAGPVRVTLDGNLVGDAAGVAWVYYTVPGV